MAYKLKDFNHFGMLLFLIQFKKKKIKLKIGQRTEKEKLLEFKKFLKLIIEIK